MPQFKKPIVNNSGSLFRKASDLNVGEGWEGIFIDAKFSTNEGYTHIKNYRIYLADEKRIIQFSGTDDINNLFEQAMDPEAQTVFEGDYIRVEHTSDVLTNAGRTFLKFSLIPAEEDDEIAQLRADAEKAMQALGEVPIWQIGSGEVAF